MKLIYRGAEYEYDPTQGRSRTNDRISLFREPITLTYRGDTYQIDPTRPVESTVERRPYELIYRGDRYWVGAPGSKPVLSRSRQMADLGAMHRANLQRNLQRRIEAAREKGDNTLLALLEAERRELI